jgi:protein gp37
MADKSTIEWTDATWNPVTGCTKISPGCDNCYAARFSERFRGVPGHPFETGFDLTLRPERLLQPFGWTFQNTITASPMKLSTVPPSARKASVSAVKYRDVWCMRASGSADSEMLVNPRTSVKRTVISCLTPPRSMEMELSMTRLTGFFLE